MKNLVPAISLYIICAAITLVVSGCYSLETQRVSYGTSEITSDVTAKILSRNGNTGALLGGGNVRVQKIRHFTDNYSLFIIPDGSRCWKTEFIIPGNLYLRWPSGAEAPISFDYRYDSFQPYSEAVPSTIHIPHPDRYGSRRRIFDELSESNNCNQTITFWTSPNSGLISNDGINFTNTLTLTWAFSFDEFMSSSKVVAINAKWPSGAALSQATIPIYAQSYWNEPAFEYGGKKYKSSVTLYHPMSNSMHYAYDMLPHQKVDIEINSDPIGAEIFYGTNSLGVSPASITRQVSFAEFCNTNLALDVSAKWKSGATQHKTFTVLLQGEEEKRFVLSYPADSTPNDADLQFAKEQIWEREYATDLPIKTLVFASDPEGATIYDGEKQIGPCPALITWAFTKEDYMAGSMKTPTFTARWPSGATTDRSFTLEATNLVSETHTFIRPATASDKDIDVNYAIQLKQIAATREAHAEQQELQRRAIEEQERQARQDDLFRAMQADEERRRESNRILMQQLNEESRRSSERMDRAIEQDRIQQQRQADERRLQMEMLQNTSKTLMDMVPKTTTGSGYIHTPSGNANYFYRQTEYGH